jgi:uncharacterized protein YaiE (UPF0345 family)
MIKINEYFNGSVKSLAYISGTSKSTVGVMEEGEYEFTTATPEVMIVIDGLLTVLLPDESEWKIFRAGQSFEVPANVSFTVKSSGQTSYVCRYL